MTDTATDVPTWEQMSDLDKGAALLHMHKVEREGREYAEAEYPCRYLDNPQLVALDGLAASWHAQRVTVTNTAIFERIGDDEYFRLYDLALDADRARP